MEPKKDISKFQQFKLHYIKLENFIYQKKSNIFLYYFTLILQQCLFKEVILNSNFSQLQDTKKKKSVPINWSHNDGGGIKHKL